MELPTGGEPAKAGQVMPQDIAIVVTEAATNVVAHAYTDTGPGPLHVSATPARRTLVLTVADAGHGIQSRVGARGP